MPIGVYGQATATFDDRLDVTAGARVDHESKGIAQYVPRARNFAWPPRHGRGGFFQRIAPVFRGIPVRPGRHGVRRRRARIQGRRIQRSVSPGFESYGEEQTWNLEGGVKTTWMGGRVMANAAGVSY